MTQGGCPRVCEGALAIVVLDLSGAKIPVYRARVLALDLSQLSNLHATSSGTEGMSSRCSQAFPQVCETLRSPKLTRISLNAAVPA